ncbi:hypothetical protein PVK06_017755 [Gossypium arboreum]|uniref:Uncharacterized protein n=1 Tax=Gossypium arboreum TaxID=29729 RepID=A0ABR0Q3I3_GOSAR|nr:hypothetical protein PVK06_017755 [Gossypium arboreum]
MFTVGTNNRLVGGVDIARVVEESSRESKSLSKEIDEYMDAQSFMQNVRRSLSGAFVGEGSGKCVNKPSLKELILSFHVALAKVNMSHEEDLEKCKVNTMQSFQDYLPDLKSKFLLHAQLVSNLFDARRVNFDALSHLMNAQLDFDIRFPMELLGRNLWKSGRILVDFILLILLLRLV